MVHRPAGTYSAGISSACSFSQCEQSGFKRSRAEKAVGLTENQGSHDAAVCERPVCFGWTYQQLSITPRKMDGGSDNMFIALVSTDVMVVRRNHVGRHQSGWHDAAVQRIRRSNTIDNFAELGHALTSPVIRVGRVLCRSSRGCLSSRPRSTSKCTKSARL